MKKKKLWAFIVGIAIILSTAMIYWFYFPKPASFPTDEQLIEEINGFFPEADASVIQDTLPADERHTLVPFISNKDDYGLSYWVWQKHKWRVVSIDTKGQPRIWKIDRDDPSSFQFVWNIHPEDQLSSIYYYLIRDRGYHISEGIDHYYPRVQMEKRVNLQEKSYGLMQLPNEWVAFMNSYINTESAKQSNKFFYNFFPEQSMFFGWIPYDQANKEALLDRSVNGNGYSNGKVDTDYVRILNKADIELPYLE